MLTLKLIHMLVKGAPDGILRNPLRLIFKLYLNIVPPKLHPELPTSLCSTGLILGLRPVNERRRYKVTRSLIGWAQTYNQPWLYVRKHVNMNLHLTWPCYTWHNVPGLDRKRYNAGTYSISQEICTRFLLCCALLWLYIDWFSHIHQAYFTGTVAI